jgi:hypothetical protein
VPPEPAWREERFADAFTRELLLPRAVVRAAASAFEADGVEDLAREYAVDRATVLLQAGAGNGSCRGPLGRRAVRRLYRLFTDEGVEAAAFGPLRSW